jgi:acetyltransferase-like isoleucine patch superfamily enzyme
MIKGSREIKTASIVGARSVLTKTFPEFSIIGGNPSKLFRSRK